MLFGQNDLVSLTGHAIPAGRRHLLRHIHDDTAKGSISFLIDLATFPFCNVPRFLCLFSAVASLIASSNTEASSSIIAAANPQLLNLYIERLLRLRCFSFSLPLRRRSNQRVGEGSGDKHGANSSGFELCDMMEDVGSHVP